MPGIIQDMELINTHQVLTTKLQRPDLPSDFIRRQQLLDYVNKEIYRPLTLVSSGAGFGKSTFVSNWMDTVTCRTCWLSLDENDNDLRTFLTHFVAALQQAFPGYFRTINEMITMPELPGTKMLKNTIINELNELPELVIMTMDDYHLVSNGEIHEIISGILGHPPKNFHLVIITRTDPPLLLSRLRARNKMKEVRSAHLRMKDKEIEQFIRKHLEIDDLRPVVKVLEDKLEGWITGLRLTVMYLSFHTGGEESIEKVLAGPEFSKNYFLDEVLEYLDGRTREFLMKTSVLQKFTPELADLLISTEKTGPAGSQEVIRELMKKNLFVINLDQEGKWFRYHHLFQSMLQKELKKKFPEEVVADLHRKAAGWYEENGMIDEAIYHISLAGDLDALAALIERSMHLPIDEDRWYLLTKWLDKIPDSYILQSPSLLIARMWDLHHRSIFWAIPGLLERFEVIRKENPPDKYILLQAQIFRGVMLFWSTRIKESLRLFEQVRKNLPEDKVGASSIARIYHATASQMNGTAKEVYQEIESILISKKLAIPMQVVLYGALQYIKLLEGDLFTVERLTRKLMEIGLSANDLFAQAWSYYFLGYIAFQQNRRREAETMFRRALDNKYQLNMTAPLDSFAGMLVILAFMRKRDLYDKVYRDMMTFVHERNNPAFVTRAYSLRARLALMEKDTASADRLIKMADMYYDSGTVLIDIEIPRLTLCRVLLAQDSPASTEEAVQKLQEYLAQAESMHNVPFMIRTLVLLSLAFHKKKDRKKAYKMLTLALERARPGNWIMPFIETGPEIQDLLVSMDPDPDLREFVAMLVSEFTPLEHVPDKISPPQTPTHSPGALVPDPLTNREMDILLLLAQRMSNKEIANKLFISESTVKRHTITIYQKLDVHKRREAVARAKAMGLL